MQRRPIKTICALLPKNKLQEICVKMDACEWEKEILLELYAEPKSKTVETLIFSTKDNYRKRVDDLENRLIAFLATGEVLSEQFYRNMFYYMLNCKNL